jgi:hypothetical protein
MSSKPKIKNKNLSLVKPTGKVLKSQKINTANNDLDNQISELGSVVDYDPSLLFQIMNLIENLSTVKLSGEEKQKLCVDKIIELCPNKNNEKDIEELKKYIDFFCHMKWINKVPTIQQVKSTVKTVCGFFSKN